MQIVSSWKMAHANDKASYAPTVGLLGLGHPSTGDPSLLQRLKASGTIGSDSFSLHIGSALLGQPASLVLGGYEQNRAVGPVGVFTLMDVNDFYLPAAPKIFLLDIFLGTELGLSPFNNSQPISLWNNLGGDSAAASLTASYGGKSGSASVIVDPARPYMYLPKGMCESIANYLPLSWDTRVDLFVWNTSDPVFARIIKSPAYIGFVLSDRDAKNITIKVPLQLLNLTLEPPLLPVPTLYFPCQSIDMDKLYRPAPWILGRAFLQAAFFAVNYETNMTYIAQAPGPNMDQSILQSFTASNNTTILTGPADAFARSWNGTWTLLVDNDTESSSNSLGTGQIAGIVVGVVIASLILAVGLILRHRRHARRRSDKREAETVQGNGSGDIPGQSGVKEAHEMEAKHGVSETEQIHGIHEMETVHTVHEMEASHGINEMEADNNTPAGSDKPPLTW
jgi:hypothetical protein